MNSRTSWKVHVNQVTIIDDSEEYKVVDDKDFVFLFGNESRAKED